MSEMQFPITVTSIKFKGEDTYRDQLLLSRARCGDFVAVRPCDLQYGKKTFLGVLIGEIALNQMAQFDPKTGELSISRALHNPMIFIPELSVVVFGCGSWWGKIKDPAHLQQITQEDINNVWYVQALRQLTPLDVDGAPTPSVQES